MSRDWKIGNVAVMAITLLSVSCCLVGCGGNSLPPPRPAEPDDDEPIPAAVVQPQRQPEPAPVEESSGSETRPPVPVVKTKPPEEKPQFDPAKRKRESIAKMAAIGQALAAYVKEHGELPKDVNQKLARDLPRSWRFELLPYLGDRQMYDEYKANYVTMVTPDTPSPNAYLPPDAEEGSPTTQYFLVTGPGTAFNGLRSQAVKPEKIRDDLSTTLLLVEVRKDWATYWAHPLKNVTLKEMEQYRPVYVEKGENTFLALNAGGQVVEVRYDVSKEKLRALFTIAGREDTKPETYVSVVNDTSIDLLGAAAAGDESFSGSESPANRADTQPSGIGASSTESVANGNREKPPSPNEQNAAMKVVKDLFLDRYQEASNDNEKKDIAMEMVEKSANLGDDSAGKYVMLVTAQRIALEVEDVETADKALKEMLSTYDVDGFEMKVALLKKASTLSTKSNFDTRLMDEARVMAVEALRRDEFQIAKEMSQAAVSAARRLNDKEMVASITREIYDFDKIAASHRRVKETLAEAGDISDDPSVNEMVGRHFCFMKGEWSMGLPYLARSEDVELRRLAQRELASPADAQQQLELADGWLEQTRRATSPKDRIIAEHALVWYEMAVAELPQGLPRLKAELRIKEIKSELEKR